MSTTHTPDHVVNWYKTLIDQVEHNCLPNLRNIVHFFKAFDEPNSDLTCLNSCPLPMEYFSKHNVGGFRSSTPNAVRTRNNVGHTDKPPEIKPHLLSQFLETSIGHSYDFCYLTTRTAVSPLLIRRGYPRWYSLPQQPQDLEDTLGHALQRPGAKLFGREVQYLDMTIGGLPAEQLQQFAPIPPKVEHNGNYITFFDFTTNVPSGTSVVDRGFLRLAQHLASQQQPIEKPILVHNPIGFPSFDGLFITPHSDHITITPLIMLYRRLHYESSHDSFLQAADANIHTYARQWEEVCGKFGGEFASKPFVWKQHIHLSPYPDLRNCPPRVALHKDYSRTKYDEYPPDLSGGHQGHLRIEYDPYPPGLSAFLNNDEFWQKAEYMLAIDPIDPNPPV